LTVIIDLTLRLAAQVCTQRGPPATERPLMPMLRREALCCIPGSAGRNSKGGSWVRWLTWTGNRKGTTACQESNGRAQAYGMARYGTRVTWLKLDCLNPNLQQAKMSAHRKDA
jgi:hypothetical protein